ncbi:MAG: hypothetical protein GQ570_05740 [Helicobacteraceae bacterium]|nr:hypothetical protein [Helicobacteraceae bacterium]
MNYFSYLNNVEAERIYEVMSMEQTQTIAIVLTYINADLSAQVLDLYPQETKADIAIKMSQVINLPESVLKNIADTLETKLLPSGIKLGGVKAVADILKLLDK